ncbi:threonine ammonia-lyase [Burkholderia sp. Ac-20379]|uniref:threonine ammonia-lyase n=1 Tax=Burkholderia sp. Ac-20379 TaxID=2703900 RepID=UPI001F11DD3F|nr:threonine/serine dehydratase [Burkholderia sp. Ac-20379]
MLSFQMPVAQDVRDAAERLAGVAVRTPVVRSDRLDALAGAQVFVKLESLQHTGAFKFRGAYNCLSRLDRATCPDGVVAYSTGNHGQAIATVGRMLGIPTIVVMPSNAPENKVEKARLAGATIIRYDREKQSREAVAAELAERGQYAVVPPGDHHHVIAGQGTVAFEALEQLNGEVDAIVAPCGGGGMSAGICLAVEAAGSQAQVWAAEPAAFDDTRRSLASGARESNPPGRQSICDALLAPLPAELPFSINGQRLAGVLAADDAAVKRAMALCFELFRVVVEPGGAVALAAMLSDPAAHALRGKRVVVVASGGNVDAALFAEAITGGTD